MVWSDDFFANEIQPEWRQALPGIIAGKPDRTDLMCSFERAGNRLPRLREIIAAVSAVSGFDFMTITGDSVSRQLAKARVAVVCLAVELRPDISQERIAGALKKDRAIVRKALHRAPNLRCNDNDFVHWCGGARKRLGYA